MDRTLQGGADTRPVVLCTTHLYNHANTKALGVYFRIKQSSAIPADYVFPGVRRVGLVGVATVDLSAWDCEETLFETFDSLQRVEEEFVSKVARVRATYPYTIAIALIGRGTTSRQRFSKLQGGLSAQTGASSEPSSGLMVVPVDSPDGIAGELAELRDFSFRKYSDKS